MTLDNSMRNDIDQFIKSSEKKMVDKDDLQKKMVDKTVYSTYLKIL